MVAVSDQGQNFLFSADQKASIFSRLKQDMAVSNKADTAYLPTGIACFDSALSGGLALQHIHLICAPPADAAATGFVWALLRAQLNRMAHAPVIWCCPAYSSQYGHLCAEGMLAMGIDPGRVIFIHEAHPARLLSAFEAALQTKSIAGAVCEYGLLASKSDLWLRWAQRLRRAARSGTALGLLLGPSAGSTGFETGWSVSAAPSAYARHDWRPCWSVCLNKSQKGRHAKADIYYDCISGQMHLVDLHKSSMAVRAHRAHLRPEFSEQHYYAS